MKYWVVVDDVTPNCWKFTVSTNQRRDFHGFPWKYCSPKEMEYHHLPYPNKQTWGPGLVMLIPMALATTHLSSNIVSYLYEFVWKYWNHFQYEFVNLKSAVSKILFTFLLTQVSFAATSRLCRLAWLLCLLSRPFRGAVQVCENHSHRMSEWLFLTPLSLGSKPALSSASRTGCDHATYKGLGIDHFFADQFMRSCALPALVAWETPEELQSSSEPSTTNKTTWLQMLARSVTSPVIWQSELW